MVERPPPRALQEYDSLAVETQDSPISPSLESPPKPPPRPYIRRSRSSSSMGSNESPISPSIPDTLQETT